VRLLLGMTLSLWLFFLDGGYWLLDNWYTFFKAAAAFTAALATVCTFIFIFIMVISERDYDNW